MQVYLHSRPLNSTQLVPRFIEYGKCGTFQKMNFYAENAVPTTKFNLLQYRWYRDWYRTTAFSVDPLWIIITSLAMQSLNRALACQAFEFYTVSTAIY